jgi:hypothetical protein
MPSEGMPQTDESTISCCLARALLQVRQGPSAERRGPPHSEIAQFWSLALGPWCSALRRLTSLSPQQVTHLQAFGAIKQSRSSGRLVEPLRLFHPTVTTLIALSRLPAGGCLR